MRSRTREKLGYVLWVVFVIAFAYLIVNIRYEEVWQAWFSAITIGFVPFGLALVVTNFIDTLIDNVKDKRKEKKVKEDKRIHEKEVLAKFNHLSYDAQAKERDLYILKEKKDKVVEQIKNYIQYKKDNIANIQKELSELEEILKVEIGELK